MKSLVCVFVVYFLCFALSLAQEPSEYQTVQSPLINYKYEVLNDVALEKRADYLLQQEKVTAAERRKMLRPNGELDKARCVEILVRVALAKLHSSIVLRSSTIALAHEATQP